MNREQIISELNNYYDNNEDINFDSIVYKEISKDHNQVIDLLYHNAVGITEYVHGVEVSITSVKLENLSDEILNQLHQAIIG